MILNRIKVTKKHFLRRSGPITWAIRQATGQEVHIRRNSITIKGGHRTPLDTYDFQISKALSQFIADLDNGVSPLARLPGQPQEIILEFVRDPDGQFIRIQGEENFETGLSTVC